MGFYPACPGQEASHGSTAFQIGNSMHPGRMGRGKNPLLSTVTGSWQASAKGLIGLRAVVSQNETMQYFMYGP